MNFFAIFLDDEFKKWALECADVDGSSVGALDAVDTDLDVPITRK